MKPFDIKMIAVLAFLVAALTTVVFLLGSRVARLESEVTISKNQILANAEAINYDANRIRSLENIVPCGSPK